MIFTKKILFLANSSGGLYSFRFELIERLLKNNFKVYFGVPQKKNNEKVKLITKAGAKYINTPMNRRGMNPFEDLKLMNHYKSIIKNINPDIILTYTIKPNIYGNYVANKFDIPVIMNITGMGSSLVTGKFKELIKIMYRYAGKKSTQVFFQNKGNQEFFISNKLVNEGKTTIIPGSGINIEKFQPMKKNKSDEIVRFLFIGRLMKDKGLDEYLEAAKNINLKYSNAEFQILGSFEEEKYKNIINENKRIKYLGKSADVRQEIKEVNCIVHPSYHEGMSNVLLEGAAMGKPLIASNIPGCKEIIDEGINGFLFKVKSSEDLENQLIKFMNLTEEERLKMGENSRKKVVKEFDRNIVVNEYMKAINKILKIN